MKKMFTKRFAALLSAMLALALLLSACGGVSGGNASRAERDEEAEEVLTFSTPEELYRYVETNAFAEAFAPLTRPGGGLDAADFYANADVALELFEPAQELLYRYAGQDFSWLRELGVAAGMNYAGDSVELDAAVSLNGSEIVSGEVLVDLAAKMLYGRVPQFSEDYFQYDMAEDYDYAMGRLESSMGQLEALLETLPEERTVRDILDRCLEAALEPLDDVDQDDDVRLRAGGVSARYTALTVTISERDVKKIVKNVCKTLRRDADVEALAGDIETHLNTYYREAYGYEEYYAEGELYEDFLYELDRLEERADELELEDDIVMTLYVDGDYAIRGREIEYGDYLVSCAMPEDGGEFGLELSAREGERVYFAVTGGGTVDDGLLSGAFLAEAEETEYLTLEIRDLDLDALSDGVLSGVFELKPTYEFYTGLGVYSLYARTMEDFSYVLEADGGGDGAALALRVYLAEDPFLTLTAAWARSAARTPAQASGAADLESWSAALASGGAISGLADRLEQAGVPASLLRQIFYCLLY